MPRLLRAWRSWQGLPSTDHRHPFDLCRSPEARRVVGRGRPPVPRRALRAVLPRIARIGALALCAALLTGPVTGVPLELSVVDGLDDGIEIGDSTWLAESTPLTLGRDAAGNRLDLGFRILAGELAAGDSVVFARLRFSSRGSELPAPLTFVITAAREALSPPLGPTRRPSQLPRTTRRAVVTVTEPWRNGYNNPLFFYTGDISPVLNEIMALPGWGADSAAFVICLDESSTTAEPGYVVCADYETSEWPVTLEVCRTLDEAFRCHEILLRPTDREVTISFMPLIDMEAYVEYGLRGQSRQETAVRLAAAHAPCEIVLDDLTPDLPFQYRLRYRRAGSAEPFASGEVHQARTRRRPGASYTVTIQADSHLWDFWQRPVTLGAAVALYRRTLENVAADVPDFHLALGDFSMTEYSRSLADARERYLAQRSCLDPLLHSVPFYLVLGNHEGELGWFRTAGDSAAFWAERARLELFPNPEPNSFYSGCPDSALSRPGYRQSYYAWEWGDALFVVLDPFWYTTSRPYRDAFALKGGGWAWTLGKEQYDWLYQTLADSDCPWKIVITHHLVGGVEHYADCYGRGGIEVAKHAVDQRPTFEWGGEDDNGIQIFAQQRPGWQYGPLHELLLSAEVDLVVHGHDHFCAVQELDDITYLLCPQPCDRFYDFGCQDVGEYAIGGFYPNTGHVRLQVTPEDVVIEYVRAYLEGDGPNGEVAFSYSLSHAAALAAAAPDVVRLAVWPNPARGRAFLRLAAPLAALSAPAPEIAIYDAAGRLCSQVACGADGLYTWDGSDRGGRALAPGIYYCTIGRGAEAHRARLVFMR